MRIVTSRVHPLDSTSTPYAFSSTAVPLLHKAARALNLPARSNKSYQTFLGMNPSSPALASPGESTTSRRGPHTGPLPLALTGEINVSNFHICFILPKILPTRGAIIADNDVEHTPRHRRNSFVDREGKSIMFMAGVDIFVPFASRPPRSPYLVRVCTVLPSDMANNRSSYLYRCLAVSPTTSNYGSCLPPNCRRDKSHLPGTYPVNQWSHISLLMALVQPPTNN